MCSLQRIFHVLTKRQSFPSARRLLLGHGHGNHREPCDTPVGSLTYGLHPGQGARTSALYLAPRPTAPGGGLPPKPPPPARGAVAARKAHVCCPGHKQRTLPVSRQGPWCQPHGESQIVVVCLCLLKLGRGERPPSQDCLECAPERCADGSVSKLRKRAGRAGRRPRSGPAGPATRRRGGKAEGLHQDRGPFCVDAILPSLMRPQSPSPSRKSSRKP